ncbi:MAG: ribosomal L7Ae/L30e/S12e/Gadd45 family protein [Oscillospiraceae bacterium]|nr:ribosomal L7Ae/L30e/S12e/Gadd45 family protein [Oscillospiraceae bacterium]
MENSYLGLLGLARRAGLLSLGDESVRSAVSAKTAKVLFVASDASERTKETFEFIAESADVLYIVVSETREELGNALGKRPLSTVAVCDVGIAAAITKKLAATNEQAAECLPLLAKKAEKSAARRRASRAKKAKK